jgi:DNA-binding transcriptional LysR family regulator
VQKSTALNWDDLRYALALSTAGSLARAAKVLGVDHTTVGRRIDAAEKSLGTPLFTRATTGYQLTQDGERLLGPMRAVEQAVFHVERAAISKPGELHGNLRVTSPETFGVTYLAPRLAAFGRSHVGLTVELHPSGAVFDLGRGEADIAVRLFRSQPENLVVRRVAEIGYGLYASAEYLAARPDTDDLARHPLLTTPPSTESRWLDGLSGGARPAFVSELTLALVQAALAHAGIAVLPRYLGDAEAGLRRIARADEPADAVWLTVHRDLKEAPRVRAALDFLAAAFDRDRALLKGA